MNNVLFQPLVDLFQFLEKLRMYDSFNRVKMLNNMKNPPTLLETLVAKQIVDGQYKTIDIAIAALSVLKNSRFHFAKSTYDRHWTALQENFFYIDCGWKTSGKVLFAFVNCVSKELYYYIPFFQLNLFHGDKPVTLSILVEPEEKILRHKVADGIVPDAGRDFAFRSTDRKVDSNTTQWLVGNSCPSRLRLHEDQVDEISDKFPLLLSVSPGKKFVSCQGEITLKSLSLNQWPVWKPYVSIYNNKYVWATKATKEPPLEGLTPIQTNDLIVFTRTDVEDFGGIIKLHEHIEGNRFRCTIYAEIQNKDASLSSVKELYRDCVWTEVMQKFRYKYDKKFTFSDKIATFRAYDE